MTGPGSMDDLTGLLTTIFAISTAVSTAVAGLVWGTVKTLRDSRDDLSKRVEQLEKREAESQTKIAQLTADNGFLTRTLTGEVQWHEVVETLNLHHEEAIKHWKKDEELLQDICKKLESQGRTTGR